MGGIQRKIELAKSKWKLLLSEEKILNKLYPLLEELKVSINNSNRMRFEIGMTKICADCGTHNNSCCGSEIELKYSCELLIINLLYGIDLNFEPELKGMCYFLKKDGCILFARDVFCINFVCNDIREKISALDLKNLRELEGKCLNIQFEIEEFLKKFFSSGVL